MTNNISFRRLLGAGVVAAALVVVGVPALVSAATLYRQLEVGSTGSDVSALQSFLAQDPSVYPEGLVTGYFGTLTQAAVSRFQTRNDIPSVGRVGPITMSVINAQMSGGISTSGDINAPVIYNIGLNRANNTATISWNTNEPSRGVIHYSDIPLTVSESLHSVAISGSSAMTDVELHNSQSITLQGLQRNVTYYYMLSSIDQAGNVSVTMPATFRLD